MKGLIFYKTVLYMQIMLIFIKLSLYIYDWLFKAFKLVLSYWVVFTPTLFLIALYLIFIGLCTILVRLRSSK